MTAQELYANAAALSDFAQDIRADYDADTRPRVQSHKKKVVFHIEGLIRALGNLADVEEKSPKRPDDNWLINYPTFPEKTYNITL